MNESPLPFMGRGVTRDCCQWATSKWISPDHIRWLHALPMRASYRCVQSSRPPPECVWAGMNKDVLRRDRHASYGAQGGRNRWEGEKNLVEKDRKRQGGFSGIAEQAEENGGKQWTWAAGVSIEISLSKSFLSKSTNIVVIPIWFPRLVVPNVIFSLLSGSSMNCINPGDHNEIYLALLVPVNILHLIDSVVCYSLYLLHS